MTILMRFQFMFPHAFGADWDERSLPPPPTHHLFALTSVTGDRLYGASLCFFESTGPSSGVRRTSRIPDEAIHTSTANTNNNNNNEEENVGADKQQRIDNWAKHDDTDKIQHHAKALCLLSRRPVYTGLLRYLEQLLLLGLHQSRATSDGSSANWFPVEQTLINLLHEVPAPHRGLSVQVAIADAEIVLECPPFSEFPFDMDAEVMTFAFMVLEPKVVVQLYHHLLLEHRLLIVGQDSVLVTSLVESVKALLFPFTWLHVFIPNVPDAVDLNTLLEAPVPFIAGAHVRQLEGVVIPTNVLKLEFVGGRFVLSGGDSGGGEVAKACEDLALPNLPAASQEFIASLTSVRLPDQRAQKKELHQKLWDRRIQLQKSCLLSFRAPAGSEAAANSKPYFLLRPTMLYRKLMKRFIDLAAGLLDGVAACASSGNGSPLAFAKDRYIQLKPASERVSFLVNCISSDRASY